jgi:cell division protein FtsI (penicillin-binding protein 3)
MSRVGRWKRGGRKRSAFATSFSTSLLRGARFGGRRSIEVPSERARRERLSIVIAAVGLGFLALAARCAHLQIVRGPELVALARSQHEKEIPLDPRRGPIVDRNGQALALSIDVDSVFADPSEIGDAAAAAHRLAPILGLKAGELRERLQGDTRFVWLKRKIDPGLRARIEALELHGVGFVKESRRFYPQRDLAAHVVGGCGLDNQGLAGLEFAYNDRFNGTPGHLEFLRDGRGGRVLDRERVEAIPGDGLELTLDAAIQHIAERELDTAMRDTRAKGAAIVVLRPQTGEVLALASRPGFDPNEFSDVGESQRHNRAVSDFFEPGSTFKVITAAAALEAGKVRPNEVIWCENGSIVVAKHRIHEDKVPFGNLTFTEVLAHSSNVGTVKVAQRLSSTDFIAAIRRFGFGKQTALELPGESPGLLRDLPRWSGLSHASIAMGQEIGVTPIQLAAAIGAIANDGEYRPPFLVRGFIGPDGTHSEPPRDDSFETHRTVSARTARTLRDMLQSVTLDGTGKAASVIGYTTGGKTGTAQKIDPVTHHYSHGRYAAWFAGFVPADDPALVIVVMVDEPGGEHRHGGDVSAPVFSRVAEPVLRYLGVLPDRDRSLIVDPMVRASGPRRFATDPGVAVASNTAASRDRARVVPAEVVPAGVVSAGLLSMFGGDATGPAGSSAPVAMPNLTGLSLRQATDALARLGLNCSNQHLGQRVTRQEPVAGAPIGPDVRCALILE